MITMTTDDVIAAAIKQCRRERTLIFVWWVHDKLLYSDCHPAWFETTFTEFLRIRPNDTPTGCEIELQ
jgi:hypothetical protein